MSGVSLGQAIGIIGGVPILKNVLGHTVDKLKIPRHLDIGSAPGILKAVLSGGPSALLQSPLGASLTSLTSGVTSAIGALTSAGIGGSLSTALNNLSTSATSLSALADNLVGFATNTALPTQIDLVAHMGVVQSLGGDVPASLSLATVLEPVQSSPLLTAVLPMVNSTVAAVIAGTQTPDAAVVTMQGLQAGLDAVTNASTGAIAAVQAAQPALCAAQSAVALLVAGSPDVVAAMRAAIRPDMLPLIDAFVAAHNETLATSAASQASVSAALASMAEAQAAAEAQTAGNVPFTG